MCKRKTVCIFIVILVDFSWASSVQNKSSLHGLYKELFVTNDYNKHIRPVVDATTTTVVDAQLSLLSLINFDEVAEQLTLTGKLKLWWKDEYLTWNPSDHDGVTSINVPQGDVWKPDLMLENSVTKYFDLGASSMYVKVDYNGTVLWKPMEVFVSTCSVDVVRYPFGSHECCLNIESWSHAPSELRLNSLIPVVELREAEGQTEWKVDGTSATHRVSEHEEYLVFCLTLRRHSLQILLNVVLPITLLSLLSCCVFILPASSGEKASFSVTVFLSLAVFLTIVSQDLPKASNSVAIFNIYVFTQVITATLSTIVTLVQIRLYNSPETRPVPKLIQRMICKKTSKSGYEVKAKNAGQENGCAFCREVDIQHVDVQGITWSEIANRLDLVLFTLFTSVNVVVVLVCIVLTSVIDH